MMREDWIESRLGEMFETITGNTPSKKEIWNYGKYVPFIKPPELNNRPINNASEYLSEEGANKGRVLPEGSVLVTCIGNLGRTGISKYPVAFNQQINALKPNNAFDSNFTFYQCQNPFFSKNLENLSSATTVAIVNKGKFNTISFKLAPLPEQRAIVAKIEQLLSDLDNGIANLKTAKGKLEIYRQAVLKKAFEGELTKEWRQKQTDLPTAEELLERIKEERLKHYETQIKEWEESVAEWEANGKQGKKPSKPQNIKFDLNLNCHESQILNELPGNWTYVNIDFISSKLGDGIHGTPKYSDGDYYFINGNNLQDGKIVFKNSTKKVSKKEALKHYRELNDRTVLVSINGTLGKVAFYDRENVILGKSACYFNLLSLINKNLIRWIIESNEFKTYANKTATGTTIKNVPLKAMREFIIPLCSHQEQAQIVQEIDSRLSVCDKLSESIDQSLDKSQALRQSILKKAFEGKLLSESELEACRHEHDWEPAYKLLERIKKDKVKSSNITVYNE